MIKISNLLIAVTCFGKLLANEIDSDEVELYLSEVSQNGLEYSVYQKHKAMSLADTYGDRGGQVLYRSRGTGSLWKSFLLIYFPFFTYVGSRGTGSLWKSFLLIYFPFFTYVI